jgi:uncharacterized protein YbjT (DUF2867 family)
VVGRGDILVNNIAFFLRHLPVFTIFGRGDYRAQPMDVDAFAAVAVDAIGGDHHGQTVPVAGPDDWTFRDMVRTRPPLRKRARAAFQTWDRQVRTVDWVLRTVN